MKRLLLILCILLAAKAGAQHRPGMLHLTRDSLSIKLHEYKWLFHNGDDTLWAQPGYNDSGWQALHPGLLYADTAYKKFTGFGWFRMHLYTDSSIRNLPLSIAVKQDGASEVYLDGKRIAAYGRMYPRDSAEHYNPKSFPRVIPSLDTGHHVLAVRYANYYAQEEWESYNDANPGFNITLYGANSHLDAFFGDRTFASLVLLILGGVFLALFVFHIFLWMYNRSDKANLYFSVLCFSACLAFFVPYINALLHKPTWTLVLSYSGVGITTLILISLSGVTNKLFSKSTLRFRIMAIACLLPALIAVLSLEIAFFVLAILALIVLVESTIITIVAIYRKIDGARIVGVGILFFTLFFFTLLLAATLNKGINLNGGWLSLIVLSLCILAMLSIPVSMSVYMASRFVRLAKALQRQLQQVQMLSEKTIAQEQEKQQYLETEKERLEKEVTVRTAEIVAEKQKSDDLLRNILPEEVANELKQNGASEAKYFDHVTVIFTDFVDFTKAGERFTPQQLVDELHTCFKAFDEIISKYHIEKIKTIGDAYLAVSGLPGADENHAIKTVKAALDIKQYMNDRKKVLGDKTFDIRIGLHSGSVVAGIVGVKKFAYDIWGDTVNTAARMEQSSLPDKINISQSTYDLVKNMAICTYRGEIAAKNKGDMNMYFVDGLQVEA